MCLATLSAEFWVDVQDATSRSHSILEPSSRTLDTVQAGNRDPGWYLDEKKTDEDWSEKENFNFYKLLHEGIRDYGAFKPKEKRLSRYQLVPEPALSQDQVCIADS